MGNRYNDKEQEAVRKTLAGEKNKLSKMTFSEKVDYIWTYYKLHMLAVALVLIVVGWGVHHAMTYVQYQFYGMVINSSNLTVEREEDLHDYLGMGKHDGVSLTADLYTDDNVNMGGYGNKLTIYVMAGQMDFAFTDQDGVDYLKEMGAFLSVEDVSDPVREYFGLDDSMKYLVRANLSGNQEYMDKFDEMLEKIESGEIKGE